MIRIGILFGGQGSEREVSLLTGRTICDHLDPFKYEVVPIFQHTDGSLYILPWRFLHRGKTSDFTHRLSSEAKKISWDSLKERIDFMYIAMHGRFAEDGTVQGFLEVLGIPYLGSKVYASALGMDKVMQKKLLKAGGIAVPEDITVYPRDMEHHQNNPQELIEKASHLGFPLVAKPHKEGSSIGITVVQSKEELLPAVVKAANCDEHGMQAVLVEKFIEGMEFACIVITDHTTQKPIALPPTEIVCDPDTTFFDYDQKYMPGRATKFTPARCSDDTITRIQQAVLATHKALGFHTISRIDGFATKNGSIVITDPNSFSGMAPSAFIFRQAAEIGLSHTELINHIIESELSYYGMLSDIKEQERKEQATMNKQSKKRVGVLLGGRNHEKEVSLDSGRNVFYKLSPHKYEPIPLFVSKDLELYQIDQKLLVRNSTKEIAQSLTPDMKVSWSDLYTLVDFVFIALHGDAGENGSIQGTLEMLGLPYNGSSVLTSALCMDKYNTAQFLGADGFSVPKQYLVDKEAWQADQKAELFKIEKKLSDAELIIKPHDDGCSVMVAKTHNPQEKIAAIEAIFADGKDSALVEECLAGIELTIGVVGNQTAQALPPSQTVSTQDVLSMEEKFLPGAGENQTPAPLPQTAHTFIKKTIEDVYTSLNCRGYVRIDCFYQTAKESPTGTERLVILEVNSLPALTPATCLFHQAAEIGLKPMELIDLIIELGFEEFDQRGIVVTTDTSAHSSATSIAMAPPALEQG